MDSSQPATTSAELLATARRALARGDLEIGEETVHRALQASTRDGDSLTEVRAAVLLAELLVTQRSADQALDLLRHAVARAGELPQSRRRQLDTDLAIAQRYLDELEPVDPRFVEWAD